jgi:hypothetical protein
MRQLTVVRDFRSCWEECLIGDPVRPHIPAWQRVSHNREYFLLNESYFVHAVTCVAYLDSVPTIEDDLFVDVSHQNVACFYTVWSNVSGAGRDLLNKTLRHIKATRPHVDTACTLSPKTLMARRFHLTNRATLYRENKLTDNYVYDINTL